MKIKNYFPALVLMGLGLTVCFGWIIGSKVITQIHPTFAAMQFNTALGFVLGGFSLFLLRVKHLRSSGVCSVLLGALGFLTFCEYIFGVDLGIDLLFHKGALATGVTFPGRMSPTTAFSFTVCAVMLGLQAFRPHKSSTSSISQVGGILIACIGTIALFGYLTGANLIEAWSSYVKVAAHTAFGFLVLGASIYFSGKSLSSISNSVQTQRDLYFSASVGALGFIAIAFVAINIQATNDLIALHQSGIKSEKLIGKINHLDEVLTMSARMTALTGEKKWEDRYQQFDSVLADALNELLKDHPEVSPTNTTFQANQNLVKMEQKGLQLIRKGQAQQAIELLNSPEYEKQKLLYKTGMEQTEDELAKKITQGYTQKTINVISLGSFSLLFLTFSFVGWFVVTRRMRALNSDLTALTKSLEERVKVATETIVKQAKLTSLGEMSAGIAHEINNPLAIIEGNANLLTTHLNDPTKLEKKIEKIQASCSRISKIVRGLKRFSRYESSAQHTLCSLSDIVQEATALMEYKSKRDDTPVSCEVQNISSVKGNGTEIEQVVINLVGNALDAVRGKADRWVKVSTGEDAKGPWFRVTDSGKGIPKEVQGRLFEPFFTTKIVGEGTGLGLSISKGILESHHATITLIKDFPNTCFEVRFPKNEVVSNAA